MAESLLETANRLCSHAGPPKYEPSWGRPFVSHYTDAFIYAGALDPVLSLDELSSNEPEDDSDRVTFDYPDPSPGADEQIDIARLGNAVASFVSSLKPRDQEIIRRLFWLGDTQAAVARHFGVSRMAISKAMAKISERGRQVLAPYRYLNG